MDWKTEFEKLLKMAEELRGAQKQYFMESHDGLPRKLRECKKLERELDAYIACQRSAKLF